MPKPRAFGQHPASRAESYNVEIRFISLFMNADSTVHWNNREFLVQPSGEIWLEGGRWKTTVTENGHLLATLESGPRSMAGQFADGIELLYLAQPGGKGLIRIGDRELKWWTLADGVDRVGIGESEESMIAMAWKPWQDSYAKRRVKHLMRLTQTFQDDRLNLAIILAPAIARSFGC